ncbi:MAG: UvrD-helicase domain-containing protein [candidate division KSB1 bacterium]|nr:UvrD-helicase domain-containing protein [candidate division KSB1 bacterium]
MKRSAVEKLLAELNEEQRQAVMHTNGPVLVLAGAGSGKTRVLTYRIAYLIATGAAQPNQILAVTFTNKAAEEMKRRVEALLGGGEVPRWVGTFHSVFARILRREGERLGFSRDFVIFDETDQLSVIKQGIKDLHLPENGVEPRAVRHAISQAKSHLIFPDEFERRAADPWRRDVVVPLYRYYQRFLRENNALDFDDLLVNPILLFEQYPDVLRSYQERFRYILVDEYQDTNRAQYILLKLLSAQHRNLCVVGDDDQSIYGWRGADIRNILDFQKDFPDCAIYRLERNYRSTETILNAANSVISKNKHRWSKRLWTDRTGGDKVVIVRALTAEDEARRVVELIEQEVYRNKRNFKDFAILYRTNAQSRILEQALQQVGIAYEVVGGVRFFERKEIKDILSYLRVICNPLDTFSLRRILNFPPRGIGQATIARLEEVAQSQGIPLFEAMRRAESISGFTPSARRGILSLVEAVERFHQLRGELSAAEIATALVDQLGIRQMYKEAGTEEARDRLNNIDELLYSIAVFCRTEEEATLERYLEQVALLSDIDSWDDRANVVTLMTLHSAKGLEFPVVFITGLEEGLFPLRTALEGDVHELEEERRLFYVGATRAKEKLYLTLASYRRRWSMEEVQSQPSRFLLEIDERFVEFDSGRSSARKELGRPPSRPRETEPALSYSDSTEEDPYREGRRVRHPAFGEGTIVRVLGSGERRRLTVVFDEFGEKTLVLKYAPIELL